MPPSQLSILRDLQFDELLVGHTRLALRFWREAERSRWEILGSAEDLKLKCARRLRAPGRSVVRHRSMRPLEQSLVETRSLRPDTVLICLRNASDRTLIG